MADDVSPIARAVKTLPGSPGVYRMLNAGGDALYVGKAKNLKKRVAAYADPAKHGPRLRRMIEETAAMEFTTTRTEAEALLLEADLIKKLKPRYNILLRDDKSFPYILLTADHDFPMVMKHRGAKSRKGAYFGPFASTSAVNDTLSLLQKAFLLRNCTDGVFAQRTRPCLQYQIRRCTAPCVGKVSHEDYAKQADMALRFLKGKSRGIQDSFAAEMQKASDALDFEKAATFRDRIKALTHVQSRQSLSLPGDTDVVALHREGGIACVQVFFFRGGQSYGNRAYFPRHDKNDAAEDILSSFLAQFYAGRPAPDEILTSHNFHDKDVLSEALSSQAEKKVSFIRPARGQKKDAVSLALKNAKEALARRHAEEAAQTALFDRLAEAFNLDAAPERIEVYDNSHISGTLALGAMIVATPEGFQKNAYRKFNAKEGSRPGDDVGLMRETLARRFRGNNDAARPDLLLIDGGQGQLNAALKTLADLGLSDIPVIAIAKGPDRNAGRERFFMAGQEPFSLPPDDQLLYFLQRLRDEAHRFAIMSHRARRSKALVLSPLDEVPGIGGGRKKALLTHFGSAKAVAEAGVADLQKVSGISKALAEKIHAFFHDGGK